MLDALGIDTNDPARDPRFPTRAPATIMECRGLIHLREREVDDAVSKLEQAVSCFPHSRSYYGLALALEERAVLMRAGRREVVDRALRLLGHAECLRPSSQPSDDVTKTVARLSQLGAANGHDNDLDVVNGNSNGRLAA
jgi:hypothetical protein